MGKKFQDIRKFITYIDSIVRNFKENSNEKDKVSLLTAHKAKGKEYDFVIVSGLNEDLLPHKMALDVNNLGGVVEEAVGMAGLEEERRICYVAITRAKRFLLLSSFDRWGELSTKYFDPSRFLGEMGIEKNKQSLLAYSL